MAEAQMRADMKTLMSRLIQADSSFAGYETAPNATPLVDTRTTGMAPTFSGENKDWLEWSFEFTAHMESASAISIEALCWASMEDNPIRAAAARTRGFEDYNPQLNLALALLCKGSTLLTRKNTEVNHGLRVWQGLGQRWTKMLRSV